MIIKLSLSFIPNIILNMFEVRNAETDPPTPNNAE